MGTNGLTEEQKKMQDEVCAELHADVLFADKIDKYVVTPIYKGTIILGVLAFIAASIYLWTH
ncbi:MAG TPA: hypothetical protein VHZ04_00755 [Candidatus Paceibacterota bacterium]|jgi:hypothetical protein|nr:hypothetical protein [Candidatus Paceibacterota bacterium]